MAFSKIFSRDTLLFKKKNKNRNKLFSGDLPELIYDIIKYFQNDFSTLHSCILVNRLWCRITIPLLWENPFSIPTNNYKFIEFYLNNLNDELKTKLNEYKVIDNLLNSNTLFNYLSFIKCLNICRIVNFIDKWSGDILRTSKLENRDSESNFKKLIQTSLFKTFIENELHTLEIEILTDSFYLDDIFELILQNTNSIHNIKNLTLSCYSNTLINNRILQVINSINSHQNLKKIVLYYEISLLYKSLFKDYNCSNTLNTIIFSGVNLKHIINLEKVFEQLNVLESVHIIYCYSFDTSFIQQIINLTKPFKLKSLFIEDKLEINESLQLLLHKYGNCIENFGIRIYCYSFYEQQLLELITKYCKNIKFFHTYDIYIHPEMIHTHLLFNFIKNIKHNLNYLTIICGRLSISSILLQNLGQVLPYKLEYLNLQLDINASDFKVFLKNSKGTFIKELLIINCMHDDNILPYIKKYIMKKKRVKYLSFRTNGKELFDLNDEVKEFKLYGIRVQKYCNNRQFIHFIN
ncbi:hypothetical protein C1646_762267 [Rhizophagus diaphanus]|nr:hypothetical protein C1646_762267 [Rhizophagus diaphanus] [Rhizophagus sp. MUCL 43196]